MRFDKRESHGDHEDRAEKVRMMRRGARLFAKGFLRGEGRGGPFGRFGRGFGEGFDGEGFGGRGRGHGHGGRGRGGRMFAQGELRLLLLSLLTGEQRHGYDLIRAIEDLTGGAYAPSPGVVYPTLSLLVDEGLIAETPGDGARRAFAATEAGQAEAAARADEIAAIIDRLKALAEASNREASPSILRAMANLKLALKGRVFAAAFNETVAHQIADILDEAARRIERL
jgi:DNA-binding PadR family transcriptional regulator